MPRLAIRTLPRKYSSMCLLLHWWCARKIESGYVLYYLAALFLVAAQLVCASFKAYIVGQVLPIISGVLLTINNAFNPIGKYNALRWASAAIGKICVRITV